MYDAAKTLREATKRHKIHLSLLVAETSLWVNPEVYNKLFYENSSGAWYPWVRRSKAKGEKKGQIKGKGKDKVRLDDNTYANYALKRALGIERDSLKEWAVCHVWKNTTYDPRYHTSVANLVLIPQAIAGLSDFDRDTMAALRYRAFTLYKWYPKGERRPSKPKSYPNNWKKPQPFTENVKRALNGRKQPRF